jgi:hypothetical protein
VSPARKRFAVASGLPASAEEATDVTTPGRRDAGTPGGSPKAAGGRRAFTWRLPAERADALDEMTLRVKRDLGRLRLDKAEMLDELLGLAEENPGVYGALIARMQARQTS